MVSIELACKVINCPTINFCGGTFVNEWYVLIAAHCILKWKWSPFNTFVRAGSSMTKQGGTKHVIEKYAIHENFDPKTLFSDIAVLRLKNPIKFDGKTTRAIELFNVATLQFEEGADATMAGWGSINDQRLFFRRLPRQLNSLEIKMIRNWRCERCYEGIPDGTICAALSVVSPSMSYVGSGDSGGPLVLGGKLAGVVSFGAYGICPDVFTNVAYFRDWIDRHTAIPKR